jgi:hypothetical protein
MNNQRETRKQKISALGEFDKRWYNLNFFIFSSCVFKGGMSLLSASYKILSSILLSRLSPYIYMKLLGIFSEGFNVTDELLIRIFHSSGKGEQWENYETVHKLFIDVKKSYDSVRRKVL